MPLENFQKKFASFPSICTRISKFEHFAVTEHTGTRNQIFLERYPKICFSKMVTWVLLDVFLNGFSKFGFFTVEICIKIWDF
jgi:hypothetical protein